MDCGDATELMDVEKTGFKVDLHSHILPKRWPDLKEVSRWVNMLMHVALASGEATYMLSGCANL